MATVSCWFTASSVTISVKQQNVPACRKLGYWRETVSPTKSDKRWLSKKLERNFFEPEKAKRIAEKVIHMIKCAEEGTAYDW